LCPGNPEITSAWQFIKLQMWWVAPPSGLPAILAIVFYKQAGISAERPQSTKLGAFAKNLHDTGGRIAVFWA
jgi:hypothetical protein